MANSTILKILRAIFITLQGILKTEYLVLRLKTKDRNWTANTTEAVKL